MLFKLVFTKNIVWLTLNYGSWTYYYFLYEKFVYYVVKKSSAYNISIQWEQTECHNSMFTLQNCT